MNIYPNDFKNKPPKEDQEGFRTLMFIISSVLFLSILACIISNCF